jgi:sugar lactone lactonase YvrE
MRVNLCRWIGIPAVLMLLAAGFPAWRHFAPVAMADGWAYRDYLKDIPRVSALAWGADGRLYVSEELPRGKGRIIRIAADGSRDDVVTGLSKPDGMARYRNGIALSQEGGELPLLWWRDGQASALFAGRQLEGVATDGHYLYAIEDVREDGRILRYDPDTRGVATLRSGLRQGEGIAVCPDGAIFYTEKKSNHVVRMMENGQDQVVQQELNAPGFLFCDADGLWITEDATHGARLLLLDPGGRLQVIASRLRSAQTLLPTGDGRFLLAEQGRNRILRIERLKRSL